MIKELEARTNPLPCLHCGLLIEEGELLLIKTVPWSNGTVDKVVSVICPRCKNIKFASITQIVKRLESE